MKTEITIESIKALQPAARRFLKQLGENKIVAFYGDLGAGKTTFIKALCLELGVESSVCSPSFSLINEYLTTSGQVIYHFDFYRIKTIEEVYDLGYEEYFFGGYRCFIEWPEKVETLLPENTVRAYIKVNKDGSRVIHF